MNEKKRIQSAMIPEDLIPHEQAGDLGIYKSLKDKIESPINELKAFGHFLQSFLDGDLLTSSNK